MSRIVVVFAVLVLVGFGSICCRAGGGPESEGFAALFDGHSLAGWKGLVADPPHRAKMSAAELAAAQTKADERMRAHWARPRTAF